MALKIYELNDSLSFQEISAGTFADPVSFGVVPGGSGKAQKLFLRNDDNTKWYNDIVLAVTSTTGQPIVDGSVSIKLLSGDARPTEDRWSAALANSNALIQSPILGGSVDERFPEIGEAGTADVKYYPFWIRVEVAKGAPIGDSRFSLELSYTENIV